MTVYDSRNFDIKPLVFDNIWSVNKRSYKTRKKTSFPSNYCLQNYFKNIYAFLPIFFSIFFYFLLSVGYG